MTIQDEVRNLVRNKLKNQKQVAKETNIEPNYFNRWLIGHVDLGAAKIEEVRNWAIKGE